MKHNMRCQVETRDLPPEDGWRVIERTGQARTTCPCGLDTGLIATAEAALIWRDHGLGATWPAALI